MLTCFLEERISHLDASHNHFGGSKTSKLYFSMRMPYINIEKFPLCTIKLKYVYTTVEILQMMTII